MTRAFLVACVLAGCVGVSSSDHYGSPTTVTSLDDQGLHLSVHVFGKDKLVLALDDGATSTAATVDHTYALDALPARAEAPVTVGNLPVTFDTHGCITPATIYERVVMTDFETHPGTSDFTASITYDCLDRDGTNHGIPTATTTIVFGVPAEMM